VFPVGIGLRDPRSQKRDLGHPSISTFDIAEGTSFVISPLTRLSESAAREDKGKGNGSAESGCWTEAPWIGHRLMATPGLREPARLRVENRAGPPDPLLLVEEAGRRSSNSQPP
jgi:hypothetical protein